MDQRQTVEPLAGRRGATTRSVARPGRQDVATAQDDRGASFATRRGSRDRLPRSWRDGGAPFTPPPVPL